MKQRLDREMARRKLVATRSQAENYIKLGQVTLNGKPAGKPGLIVDDADIIRLKAKEQYVSRAGLKLASVADKLHLDFKYSTMLDVGSSTGGFTDYALKNGAKKVIAVDVGTNQLHKSLRLDPRIELHEQTDIRSFKTTAKITHVVVDVSFISLRDVLPAVYKLIGKGTWVIAMAKPQFEAGAELKHKGVIKNEKIRRNTLKQLENWIKNLFIIVDKVDAEITGEKGNLERFYLLKPLA